MKLFNQVSESGRRVTVGIKISMFLKYKKQNNKIQIDRKRKLL